MVSSCARATRSSTRSRSCGSNTMVVFRSGDNQWYQVAPGQPGPRPDQGLAAATRWSSSDLVTTNGIKLRQGNQVLDQIKVLRQQHDGRLRIGIDALHGRAHLAQKIDEGAAVKSRQVCHVWTQRAADRAETGDLNAARLIDHDAVDGKSL